MANIIDANGLQVEDFNSIRAELEAAFKEIYGQDINVDQNSPDGQAINIFAQAAADNNEEIAELNASFDPDYAQGRILDERVAINGITRRAGTYTFVPLEITTNRACSFKGLSGVSSEADAYTVQDGNGNKFYLTDDLNAENAGVYTAQVRAQNIGAVEVLPNTINTPVTIVLGVVSVNNPQGASSVGIDEETDAALKERRWQTLQKPSTGFPLSLEGALKDLNDVSYAKVYENWTDTVDADGIPAHGIWVVVGGGTDQEIGDTIWAKRSGGVNMKGAIEVYVPDCPKPMKFDRVGTEDIYIELTVEPLSGTVNVDDIKSAIISAVTPGVNESVNINMISCAVREFNPDLLSTDIKVSLNGTEWFNIVSPQSKKNRLLLQAEHITVAVVEKQ